MGRTNVWGILAIGLAVSGCGSGAPEASLAPVGQAPRSGDAGPVVFGKGRVARVGGRLQKSFELEIDSTDHYCLGAWLEGLAGDELGLKVDDEALSDVTFKLSHDGWQSLLATGAGTGCTVPLTVGRHTLSVTTTGTAVPNVERLTVSGSPAGAELSGEAYTNYVESLTREPGSIHVVTKQALPQGDPSIAYAYAIDEPVLYTYARMIYLTAGASVSFETSSPSPNCNPVLHLYAGNNPTTHSWTDDDGAGFPNARLAVTIPETGFYTLVVRALDANSTGTVTLTQNGVPLSNKAAVSGRLVSMASRYDPSSAYAYFTCCNSAPDMDPLFWLLDTESGDVVATADDYPSTGNFLWHNNARVSAWNIGNPPSMLLAGFASYNPPGTADVYGKTYTSVDLPNFPNLNRDDELESGWADPQYNCIAWSGGMTSTWLWPPNPDNPWYVEGDALQSFHNFYANQCAGGGRCPRYDGALTYGDYSSSPEGAAISLWYSDIQGDFTHAAVTKPAHGLPHGFDWESKLGQSQRIFHFLPGLVDDEHLGGFRWGGYGHIAGYYRLLPEVEALSVLGPRVASERSATELGLIEPEPADDLDALEKNKLASLRSRIPGVAQERFVNLLAAWKATWTDEAFAYRLQSNPALYRRGDAYEAFEAFVRSLGKTAWPMLLGELAAHDPIGGDAVLRFLLPGNEGQLRAAVDDWVRHQTAPNGKFRVFSPGNARIRFARRLLAGM